MTLARQAAVTDRTLSMFSVWISRGLETLWLLTVVLVPLAFLDRDYALSEAIIAYVEVPKVALLRTLAGLMAILWLIEWGIQGRLPFLSQIKGQALKLQPSQWWSKLVDWLRVEPTRWVVLAVWFFLGTTLLSTVLSASFTVSLWGEIPGQDGYPTYTIFAYIVLFGVIATHLKTRAQLWRLLGAVALTGVLVAGYGVLQHYGHDFLGLTEPTGGGQSRVTSFMGNAIFSAAVLTMSIPVTLLLATMSLREPVTSTDNFRIRLSPRLLALAVLAFWVALLTVQLLGITFTLSRGPWLGTLLALAGFLGMAGLFVSWRALSRAALVLGLAGALTLAVVLEAGVVSLMALAGVLVLMTVFVVWGSGRAAPVIGIAVVLVTVGFLAFSWLTISQEDAGGDGLQLPTLNFGSTASQVEQRFASIGEEAIRSGFGGRGIHWKESRQLIRERPWFEFDTFSFPWLRSLVGYGPDLFRNTYLLRAETGGGGRLPYEPDHAHNYFVHQWVELGFLGLVSSLGIFVAPFLAGGYQLIQRRDRYSDLHRLLLIGLLATMAGRFLEQMVGVARISDLTLFWVLLAIFVALPVVMRSAGPVVQQDVRWNAAAARSPRRSRRRSSPRSSGQGYDWQGIIRLVVVAWAIGGIVALTWMKGISYPRAAISAAEAVGHFEQGNLRAAEAGLDRAIELAPDVPVYYNFKASVYASYLQNQQGPPEPECSLGLHGAPYEVCLGQKIYQTNLGAVRQRPFYWRSRLTLANSALGLGRHDEALRLYQEAVSLVPASWPLHNQLAKAYIDSGQPQAALEVLGKSLAITGSTRHSADAYYHQGIAYRDLGELEKSVQSLERSLDLGISGDSREMAQQVLEEVRPDLPASSR